MGKTDAERGGGGGGGGGGRTPRVEGQAALHVGKKWDLVRLSVRRPSGKVMEREVVRHPGAVIVVPVMSGDQAERAGKGRRGDGAHVVLIRNFRIATGAWLYECCAGTLERDKAGGEVGGFVGAGEDPRACADRELIEETGYRAGRLVSLGPDWFYTTPGLTDEQMHMFVATDLEHVGQDLEEDESIEVEVIPAARAIAMVIDGRIRDGKSMVALMLAERAGYFRG